eukprot:2476439-Prymnesium_polylepis.1
MAPAGSARIVEALGILKEELRALKQLADDLASDGRAPAEVCARGSPPRDPPPRVSRHLTRAPAG